MTSRDERWTRVTTVLWRGVLDDVVLLASGATEPVALAGGRALWALLDRPQSVAALAAELADGDMVDAGVVADQVHGLLLELESHRAVERVP